MCQKCFEARFGPRWQQGLRLLNKARSRDVTSLNITNDEIMYLDRFVHHATYYPGDDNFLLEPTPAAFGVVTCMENACFVDIPLERLNSDMNDGGRMYGVGSLDAYHRHIHSSEAHRNARDARLETAATIASNVAAGVPMVIPHVSNSSADPRQHYNGPQPAQRQVAPAVPIVLQARPRHQQTPQTTQPYQFSSSLNPSSSASASTSQAMPSSSTSYARPASSSTNKRPNPNVDYGNEIAQRQKKQNMLPAPIGATLLPATMSALNSLLQQMDEQIKRFQEMRTLALRQPPPYAPQHQHNLASISAAIAKLTAQKNEALGLSRGPQSNAAASRHSLAEPAAAAAALLAPYDFSGNSDADEERFRNNYEPGSPSRVENPAELAEFLEAVQGADFEGNKTVDEATEKLGLKSQLDKLPGMSVTLLAHQLIGVQWMVEQECEGKNFGGILGDEMGLGKTVQTIGLMCKNPSKEDNCKTTLIVAPLSLLSQWAEELEEKAPHQFDVFIYHGKGRDGITKAKHLKRHDVVLTTYHTLLSEYPDEETANKLAKKHAKRSGHANDWEQYVELHSSGPLFKVDWFRVVLDEARESAYFDLDDVHKY
ncbi:hypothetical protein OIO90_001200 [Microbotryomycetes sp. JL221]|nr:hypothetical protein OIO90_001200 [Microbotryomycetes sp. JL221]